MDSSLSPNPGEVKHVGNWKPYLQVFFVNVNLIATIFSKIQEEEFQNWFLDIMSTINDMKNSSGKRTNPWGKKYVRKSIYDKKILWTPNNISKFKKISGPMDVAAMTQSRIKLLTKMADKHGKCSSHLFTNPKSSFCSFNWFFREKKLSFFHKKKIYFDS